MTKKRAFAGLMYEAIIVIYNLFPMQLFYFCVTKAPNFKPTSSGLP